MEDKYIVIIASPGRTGTKYFGESLKYIIDNCYSIHEPDVLNHNIADTMIKIQKFGLDHMIFSKLVGSKSTRMLSEKRLQGNLSEAKILDSIRKLRLNYYSKIKQELIVESYYAWYGLLDLLPKVFTNIKIIGIVRDPRDWVRSNMNWGTHYGKRDTVIRLGFNRLNPVSLNDNNFLKDWSRTSPFEKLCWEWNIITQNLLYPINDEYYKLYRYEELFLKNNNSQVFKMIKFITKWGEKEFSSDLSLLEINKTIHRNISYKFPNWEDWSKENAQILNRYCGELMRKLDYGMEKDWLSKLDNT